MDTGEHPVPEGFLPLLRALQIIVGALVSGVVVFLVVVLALGATGRQPEGGTAPLLSYVSVGLVVVAVVARAALVAGLNAQGRKHIVAGKWRDGSGATAAPGWRELFENEGDIGRLLALYQSQTVIGAAVLEAAGLFGCVAYLIEGGWFGPGAAVVIVGLMLALQFPTRASAAAWLSAQVRLLREEGGSVRDA